MQPMPFKPMQSYEISHEAAKLIITNCHHSKPFYVKEAKKKGLRDLFAIWSLQTELFLIFLQEIYLEGLNGFLHTPPPTPTHAQRTITLHQKNENSQLQRV